MTYYVYILKCADDTYYVGSTNDLEGRIAKHNQTKAGAKYTRSRRPVELVFSEQYQTKSEALKREAEIKSYRRGQKQDLIDLPEYNLRHYQNSKHIRITVKPDGSVNVSAPKRVAKSDIDKFVAEKSDWIKKQQDTYAKSRTSTQHVDDKRSYASYKDAALRLVTRRVEHFNDHYGFRYSKIRINNTKTQWGSCSATKVLSFNYRVAFLPPSLVDYLVVHELCHLQEFNHSPRFWRLVAETIPNYKEARKLMRQEGIALY